MVSWKGSLMKGQRNRRTALLKSGLSLLKCMVKGLWCCRAVLFARATQGAINTRLINSISVQICISLRLWEKWAMIGPPRGQRAKPFCMFRSTQKQTTNKVNNILILCSKLPKTSWKHKRTGEKLAKSVLWQRGDKCFLCCIILSHCK